MVHAEAASPLALTAAPPILLNAGLVESVIEPEATILLFCEAAPGFVQ